MGTLWADLLFEFVSQVGDFSGLAGSTALFVSGHIVRGAMKPARDTGMGSEGTRLLGEEHKDVLGNVFRRASISGDSEGRSVDQAGMPLEKLTEGVVRSPQVAIQQDLVIEFHHGGLP